MQRRQPSRRAATRNISPSTASIDTLSTPMSKFSSRQASNKSSPITSVTSEDDDELNISGGKKRRGTATGEVARDVAPPRKKRREVYVEVRRTKTGVLAATSSRASSASIAQGPLPTEDENDEAILSDDELEPQEVDESDASGSEFEVSEAELLADEESDHVDSEEDVVHFSGGGKRRQPRKFASLSDEEDETMRQAVQDSIRMKLVRDRLQMSSRGAGPSTDNQHETHIDLSDLSSLSDAPDSDHPLSAKKSGKKAKGKAKEKEKAGAVKSSKARKGCNEVGQELREMRKKLGRKLTHAERTTVALYKFHPELRTAWGDVKSDIPINVPIKATQPEGLKCTLLPFQLESLHWMRAQESGIWAGGVLADEMGMGKTIQTIALFVADRKRPNLVIAPTVAVMQWKHEIEAFTEGFKVLIWHGAKREQDLKELQRHDVVLTTYAVLESTFRKQQSGFKRQGRIVKEKSALHQVSWNRIILDEAHNIKERSCNTAKAAFELKSSYKWCLSGTPLQNRVGELYSLIRFLGGDPFSYYFCKRCDCKSLHWKFSDKRSCDTCGCSPMMHTCFWNNEILTPIQKMGMSGAGETAFKKLKILLDRMMLRRTKVERADDLGLPPRVVIVRRDYFSPEEKELYLSLFSDAKRQFSTYLDSGTVLNNYSNIFSLITRMRQMACHPDLVLKSKTNAETWASAEDGEGTVCRLCNDIAEDAIVSKCKHVFDRECIKQYLNTAIEQTPDCPVCHLPLTIDLEAPAIEVTEDMRKSRQGILGRLDIDSWRSSTKIEALVEELSNLRRQDATTKSLVFSQFVNFLDLIAFRLQRAGFKVCRLEGTMSPQARDATIQHFMNNVEVTVFLVSLKAGGVALNLTEASRVYLMDSWWNPAVEFQAMDRIHRLGQHRPVQAIKLVVEDSIESRIVQLQEKKSAMVEATLSTDDAAMGRLTPQDLGFLFRL